MLNCTSPGLKRVPSINVMVDITGPVSVAKAAALLSRVCAPTTMGINNCPVPMLSPLFTTFMFLGNKNIKRADCDFTEIFI